MKLSEVTKSDVVMAYLELMERYVDTELKIRYLINDAAECELSGKRALMADANNDELAYQHVSNIAASVYLAVKFKSKSIDNYMELLKGFEGWEPILRNIKNYEIEI